MFHSSLIYSHWWFVKRYQQHYGEDRIKRHQWKAIEKILFPSLSQDQDAPWRPDVSDCRHRSEFLLWFIVSLNGTPLCLIEIERQIWSTWHLTNHQLLPVIGGRCARRSILLLWGLTSTWYEFCANKWQYYYLPSLHHCKLGYLNLDKSFKTLKLEIGTIIMSATTLSSALLKFCFP